jgi:hypothetical protein
MYLVFRQPFRSHYQFPLNPLSTYSPN